MTALDSWTFGDADYPADPYPGTRPDCSFVHDDGRGWALCPGGSTPWSWRLAGSGAELDDWLFARGAAPLAARVPLLAYGSNACPAKISWLRDRCGLVGPVVVLRARCTGLAAVWAARRRLRDGQRPATLVAAPGVVERHAVWLATPDQVRALDRCEGRGVRYRLVALRSGQVETDDRAVIDNVLAYTAASALRAPLWFDGAPVRCAEVDQAKAIELYGTVGRDGLDVLPVSGTPRADDWPDRLFVHGPLAPGGSDWATVAPLAAGRARPAGLAGVRHRTEHGRPVLRPGHAGRVPGWVLRLRAPGAALAALDAHHGAGFRRARAVLPSGHPCWVYLWDG